MPETYTQVRMFCGLAGHYRRFIKGFANLAHPLYYILGKEVKMGLVDLSPQSVGGHGRPREKSNQRQYWCSLISTNLSCWRRMLPRRGWTGALPETE